MDMDTHLAQEFINPLEYCVNSMVSIDFHFVFVNKLTLT